jgi:hypothetical protein
MSHFRGKTIGFSHRGGYWTSRYSFTPTCYGNVDNIMISNNGWHPDFGDRPEGEQYPDLFWRHNENDSHNRFYGKRYPSKITVVSNQGPSAVKIFKSLSLESNSNQWTGMCSTNINPMGSNQNELQMGQIQGFIRKEGTQYGELPRDMANSDSNIDFACMVSEILTADTVFSLLTGVGENHLAWGVEATVPDVSINGGMGTIALFRDGNEFKYFNLSGQVFTYTGFAAAMQNNPVHVHAYDAANNIIRFGAEHPVGEQTDAAAIASAISSFGMGLYVVSNPSLNGDPMRGHYLYLDLLNSSPQPVETYSINVDYENTKLDSTKAPRRNIAQAPTRNRSRGNQRRS